MMFEKNSLLHFLFVLCLQFQYVFLYQHEKPVAKTLWPESCVQNQRILNDCNWCICNRNNKYVCSARVCSEIDMFGHFNDAIQEHLVGMEGKGSWRSNGTVCEPRSHYQREGLLCVCNDDGNWPNPVCRDIFRVMHEVELTDKTAPSTTHECSPQKLYLYGCNVCMCPPSGRVDPVMCTQTNCSDDDPVFKSKNELEVASDKYDLGEVYADCELDRKYIVGCRKCVCLKNNRLICDNCKNDLRERTIRGMEAESLCLNSEPYAIFPRDCNLCTCDSSYRLFCTTKRCLKGLKKHEIVIPSFAHALRSVEPPMDTIECSPGTKYKLDCNTCFCTETVNFIKTLSCTLQRCPDRESQNNMRNILRSDCVENTVYESNCLICRCDVIDGIKRETCVLDSKCMDTKPARSGVQDLDDLHGYCEPSHIYKKDCNTCRCLSDGKVVMCTSKVCEKIEEQPITVEIVPVSQIANKPCPKNHMYKIDCNFCFCLSNGNILCTTAKCEAKK